MLFLKKKLYIHRYLALKTTVAILVDVAVDNAATLYLNWLQAD